VLEPPPKPQRREVKSRALNFFLSFSAITNYEKCVLVSLGSEFAADTRRMSADVYVG
jgi:hypothetical protein